MLEHRWRQNLADGHFATGLSMRIDIQDLSRVRYDDKRWHLTPEKMPVYRSFPNIGLTS
jgi:hypothetical protein